MSNISDREQLLNEVLIDENTAHFQKRLEERILRELARRRRTQAIWKGMRIAAGIVIACGAAFFFAQQPWKTNSLMIVSTEDLGEDFLSVERVSTAAYANADHDPFPSVIIIRTQDGGFAEEITEDELLSSLAGRSLALMRDPGHPAKLVLLEDIPTQTEGRDL